MTKKTVWLVYMIAASFTLVVPSSASAGKAYSIPVSNRVVVVELQLSDEQPVRIANREGGMIKVGNATTGRQWGLVPLIRDAAIEWSVSEIVALGDFNEGLKVKGAVTGVIGVQTQLPGAPISVKVLEITDATGALPASVDCCVHCGSGPYYCGDAVCAPCGQCCDPGFCSAPGKPKMQCD